MERRADGLSLLPTSTPRTTHGRRVGLSYVTVAVGRDYRDVAPTSGYYNAPYRSRLSAGKRVSLTAVEYAGS